MSISSFSETTKASLGNYVYCLCSILNGELKVFYIGEGQNDRIFDHERLNYSDMTYKSIEISKILSNGGKIEKYILDCGMENSKEVTGQSIAFHAENALINLAKLCNLPIMNTQTGHGILKRAMTVDEIENFYNSHSITFDIFDVNDNVMIYNFSYNNQTYFNSINRENIIQNLLMEKIITTNESRALPKYICIVYRSIIQMFFSVDVVRIEVPPKKENGRKRYKIGINSIKICDRCDYADYIGRSFGKLIPVHSRKREIFTYN